MKFLTLITLFLLPVICIAQSKISGRVVDSVNNKPIANASIFLNNASNGCSSSSDGTFFLPNVKNGQYELIISILGYETYRQTVLISGDIDLKKIRIKPQPIALRQVNIKPDPNRDRYYEIFKKEFLGSTANARKCKILNPKILDIYHDNESQTIHVSSDKFLEIENEALGYKLKYLLNSFVLDSAGLLLAYKGSVVFSNMEGSPSQQRRWQKHRLRAYQGSLMHFLRAVKNDQADEEGFKVFRLIRKTIALGSSDSLIASKILYYKKLIGKNPAVHDSLYYWINLAQAPKAVQKLEKRELRIKDFAKLTDIKGIYTLDFKDHLYIIYTKKHDYSESTAYHPTFIGSYPISIINFRTHYVFFDGNGGVLNPEGDVIEGHWAGNRVADELPLDYEPEINK
ncbi:MAG: carboxypeptidase-like regulatory domain-containing protein [Mucilaginibacter sp.]